jgi:RHS repeat-associated protein
VGTNSKYYTFDDRGNAVQRLDGAGAVVQSYLIGGHNAKPGSPASTDPYSGYGGQNGYYRDSETGLILCTYRFYDPEEGRWLNRDPIGYAGGINQYSYVGNRVTNLSDPDGLYWPAGVVVIGAAYLIGQALSPTAANAPTSATDPVYGRNERFLPYMGPEAAITTPIFKQTYYGPNHFEYYTPEERLAIQYHERFHRDRQCSVHLMQNSRDAEFKAWLATEDFINRNLSNSQLTKEQRDNWLAAKANARIMKDDYNSQPRSTIDLFGRPY